MYAKGLNKDPKDGSKVLALSFQKEDSATFKKILLLFAKLYKIMIFNWFGSINKYKHERWGRKRLSGVHISLANRMSKDYNLDNPNV